MIDPVAPVKSPRSNYARKLHEFEGIAFADQAAFQHRGRWADFFQKRIGSRFDGRIIFEAGCFDAAYLCRIALKNPQTGFIGLDWKCRAIYEGAARITEMGLRNIALIHGRAQTVRSIFADREVDEIWVFHPDPCDRPVELKNRLIAEPFLVDAHPVLRDHSSTLSLKTDHPGYYQWVLGLFGVPMPEWFGSGGELRVGPAVLPRVRLRDLCSMAEIPDASDAILERFKITSNSTDYWNDAAVLAATSSRCFAGEATLFESRFIRKKLPIYFFEIGRK